MPAILIADSIHETAKDAFMQKWAEKGYNVSYKPTLKGKELADELAKGGYDALIVGSKDVDAAILQSWRQACPEKPLCIVRSGSDFSHISIGAAAEAGIMVVNTPGANKEDLSNYITNRLPQDGQGKTLAVIGYGAIGKEVVEKASSRGFQVKAYSPHLVENLAEGRFRVASSAADAMKDADFVSITTPLITKEDAEKVNSAAGKKLVTPSFHSIDAQAIAGLRTGAHIILPSRPDVIDMTALAASIASKQVTELHINTTADDIAALKKQYPEVAAFGGDNIQPSSKYLTDKAKYAMAVQACEKVEDFIAGKALRNTIIPVKTPAKVSAQPDQLIVRQLPSAPFRQQSPYMPLTALPASARLLPHPLKDMMETRRNQLFDEGNILHECITTEHAKVFLTYELESTTEKYAYSGVRVLSPMTDEEAIQNAKRLSLTSSSWKNWLINHAVKDGALRNLSDESKTTLPESVTNASTREIYGGRAIIIPNASQYNGVSIEKILKDPDHPYFTQISTPIYQAIGERLNVLKGRLKVTPDFGPNASTADLMHQHSEHVLGINEKSNGSGGKSEYSIISILTAMKRLGLDKAPKDSQITVIGAAGALGSGVCGYLKHQGYTNVTVCDLQYAETSPPLPKGWTVAKAEAGKFTDVCLARSGKGSWLITTAYGDEMIQSNWNQIKPGTIWIGAQNKDLPEGKEGIAFAKALSDKDITHIPGQILTIGGTMASWVEWRARQENKQFSKPAAYEVVHHVSDTILTKMMREAIHQKATPYEAMLDYAHKSHWQEKSHVSSLAKSAPAESLRSRL